MVLTVGGTPIFHYSTTDTPKLDHLLSGFISAITSFATEFGERSIQSLSFEGSQLLYEQHENNYLFVFLVETGSSEKVLRAEALPGTLAAGKVVPALLGESIGDLAALAVDAGEGAGAVRRRAAGRILDLATQSK